MSASTSGAAHTWYTGASGGASEERGQAMLTVSNASQATARALTATPGPAEPHAPAGTHHVPRTRATSAARATSMKAT